MFPLSGSVVEKVATFELAGWFSRMVPPDIWMSVGSSFTLVAVRVNTFSNDRPPWSVAWTRMLNDDCDSKLIGRLVRSWLPTRRKRLLSVLPVPDTKLNVWVSPAFGSAADRVPMVTLGAVFSGTELLDRAMSVGAWLPPPPPPVPPAAQLTACSISRSPSPDRRPMLL